MEDKIKYLLKDQGIILDDDQISVVLDDSSKLLVIAGAGSGKTMTMIAKIFYLVKYKKIEEYKIMIIAFTNEAVNELKRRLNELEIYSVNVMTFHKLGLAIIEKNQSNIKIIDRSVILKNVITDLCNDCQFKVALIKILIKYFNFRINKLVIDNIMLDTINNSKQLDKFIDFLNKNINNTCINRNNELVNLFNKIKECYYETLESNNFVDFDTMISNSRHLILDGKVILDIDYFFIDEYQDISLNRFLLLKSIVDKFYPRLIAVGDDWQSIYQFAGSRVELFVDWEKMFDSASIKYLNSTYRNSQELIDIAGKIISNNKKQVNKKLVSTKRKNNPIKIYHYLKIDYDKCFYEILDSINCCQKNSDKIMILGRYKRDEIILKNKDKIRFDKTNNCYRYERLYLFFFTFHSSKGLGFDEVIIVNMNKGKYGFPSNIKNEQIAIDLFGASENDIEEERRLFYVALTRTKNNVYLMIPYFNKSIFAKELKKSIKTDFL